MYSNDEFDINLNLNHKCPFCGCSDLKILDFGYSVIEYACYDCEKSFVLNEDGELIDNSNY